MARRIPSARCGWFVFWTVGLFAGATGAFACTTDSAAPLAGLDDGGGGDGGLADGYVLADAEAAGDGASGPKADAAALPATIQWVRELAPTPSTAAGAASGDIISNGYVVAADGSIYASATVNGDLKVDGKSFESGAVGVGYGMGFVGKFGADGQFLWGIQTAVGIGQIVWPLPDGDLLLAGQYLSGYAMPLFDSNELVQPYTGTVCTARLDANGKKKWAYCGAGLTGATKCDLRISDLTVDGDAVTIIGLAFFGHCRLPGPTGSGGRDLDDVGSTPTPYLATFSASTGTVSSHTTLPVPTQPTTIGGLGLVTLGSGKVLATYAHRTEGQTSFVNDLYSVAGTKIRTLDATFLLPGLVPDGAGNLLTAGRHTNPMAETIGTTSIPSRSPFLAWFAADGTVQKVRTFDGEDVGGFRFAALGDRLAIAHGASSATKNFGGPPVTYDPHTRRYALTLLDPAGEFLRTEIGTLPDTAFVGERFPIAGAEPWRPASPEDLLVFGALTGGPLSFLGKSIVGPKAASAQTTGSIWFARTHIPL